MSFVTAQMQGAQKLRNEAHLQVRRNDEVEAQRRRWTFYETINFLITSDKDLLSLSQETLQKHGISSQIVTPNSFLEIIA